jgi:uncharacterized protein (TIGR02421 family)
MNCFTLGLEITPIHYDANSHKEFPQVRRALHRSLSRALKRTFFVFARTQTRHRPKHYQELGRRSLVKTVWDVDQKLATISDSFDLLIHLNPINSMEIWSEFIRAKFNKNPRFLYNPLPFEPDLIKRRLYAIPIGRIEDPVIGEIFREKRTELDRQITLLMDRGTERFLFGSLQLYGGVDDSLMKLAKDILNRVPVRTRDESAGGRMNAKEFAALALEAIKGYQERCSDFTDSVRIEPEIPGLMVSRGVLYIGEALNISRNRAQALIHHEIGTHMLTYYNARKQPFQVLHSGLAGYDALQEGLAVIAEYLSGGLSRPRLRLLAGRVMAVKYLIQGASFSEIFRKLRLNFDFDKKTAFTITLRVLRGGGLTKDAIYLRGLWGMLDCLKTGAKLETFFVGKFALKHFPIIKELIWRDVLTPPLLLPQYLEESHVQEHLEQIRSGLSIFDLVKRRRS